MPAPLVEAGDLSKSFVHPARPPRPPTERVTAVVDVSLSIEPGETLGLVGESGSGKSTVGRLIARLVAPDAGTVRLGGRDLTALAVGRCGRHAGTCRSSSRTRSRRSTRRGSSATSSPRAAGPGPRRPERPRGEAVELLELVGLRAEHARRYPYEFSGGQRQRIAIARALRSSRC